MHRDYAGGPESAPDELDGPAHPRLTILVPHELSHEVPLLGPGRSLEPLPHGGSEVLLVDDVVAVEHGARALAAQAHGCALRDAALISPPAKVGLDVVLAWCMGGAGGKVTRGRPHTLLDPPTGERCLRRGRRRAPGQPRSFSAFGRTRRSPPCLVHGPDGAPPLAPELCL